MKRVIFLLCLLLVESRSLLKNNERDDHSDISEEKTLTVPANLSNGEKTNERLRRSVLEPWILFDSDERELFKRSAEERDWFSNYKAVEKNFLLSFLRIRRDTRNANVNMNPSDSTEKFNPRRKRQLNTLTGGEKSELYMERF